MANALVHRTWDVNADIHISMFDDRIEIISIGGLPFGMDKEEYLRGGVSILRNPIIANIFYRLHYIEAFGTGVIRIKNAYQDTDENPIFEITDNTVRIILPVIGKIPAMREDEKAIYDILRAGRRMSSSEIAAETGMNKSKVLRVLDSLISKNIVFRFGKARGTRYGRK